MTNEIDWNTAPIEGLINGENWPAEPMLIHNMPDSFYHALPAMSGSGVSRFLESPLDWKQKTHTLSAAAQVAADIGTAVHSFYLEEVRKHWKAPVSAYGTSKAAKDQAKAWAESLPEGALVFGSPKVHNASCDTVDSCIAALESSYVAREVFKGDNTHVEKVIIWTDQSRGLSVPCRAKIDSINGHYLADLKTTSKSPPEFIRSIRSYGYDAQIAWNVRAWEAWSGDLLDPILVTVQTSGRFPVCGLDMSDRFDIGARQVSKALDKFAECNLLNYWPGYPAETVILKVPVEKWELIQ